MKVSCGGEHAIFLTDHGSVFACGSNWLGSLGLKNVEHREKVVYPREITYFTNNSIKVCDIASGNNHNLAMDVNGNVYGWGDNLHSQCGRTGPKTIPEPWKINFFEYTIVESIDCGSYHSLVKTADGVYYLFGDNEHNMCITNNGDEKISIPHPINEYVLQSLQMDEIVDVSLGYENTVIICSTKK